MTVAFVIWFAVFFESCKKDQVISVPDISFDAAHNPLTLGTGISSYAITGTIYSETGLDTVKVFLMDNKEGGTEDRSYDSFFSGDIITTDYKNYSFRFNYTEIKASLKIMVRAKDRNGNKTDSELLIINPETPSAGNITRYSGKLIGASNNYDIGHSFSTSTGRIFSSSETPNNSGVIDFLYVYNASPAILAEIFSPYFDLFNNYYYQESNWGKINSTKFYKTTAVTSADFDAMKDDSEIIMATTGITWNTDERIVTLAINDIFAFKTEAGKYGLAKVKALIPGESGSITLSVNVQQ